MNQAPSKRTTKKTKPRKLFRPEMGPDKEWSDAPTTPEDEAAKCYHYKPTDAVVVHVDFLNMPREKERLKDLVEGTHFQSAQGDATSGKDKRTGTYEDAGSKKMRVHTPHKQIPVKAGGPYLCDSDSDVTWPISMVEELETMEDLEDVEA
jgi:hypothetical protein